MSDLPTEDASKTITSADPVLVVEDNRLNQKVALLLLERLGHLAQVANNGKEAVSAVTQQRFSVILMDCHMPEMDGFEATAAIRKLESGHHWYTPIIAVTALTTAGDRQHCLESGMDDYISKPIEKDLLKSKIDQWILTANALHNPGAAAQLGRAIAGGDNIIVDKEAVNFEELKEFYGEGQLSDMLSAFMANTAEKLRSLEGLVLEQDSGAVARLTGELKNACAAIGAKQLAKLCLCEQMAVGREDWVEAQETFISMQRSFAQGRLLFQSGISTEENSPIEDSEITELPPEKNGDWPQ